MSIKEYSSNADVVSNVVLQAE